MWDYVHMPAETKHTSFSGDGGCKPPDTGKGFVPLNHLSRPLSIL